LAGLTAALTIAEQGFPSVIVERSSELGGNARTLYYTEDRVNPAQYVQKLIDQVEANPRITVHKNAEVTSIMGGRGNFVTNVSINGTTQEISHGVVIVATGGEEYKPTEYQYGKHPKVVTQKEFEAIKSEYRVTEPELAYDLRNSVDSGFPLTGEAQNRLLRLILALPHGVVAMHPQIAGLVETSSNLALVNTEPKAARIICNTRSSVYTALEAVRLVIRACCQLAGARVSQPQGYPAWTPNLDSSLLQKMVGIYRNLFQKEPEVKAVHAGLECGIIGEKYAGMDMISFGPTIRYPHSPDEKVNLDSVEKFWQFLLEALEKLTLN